MIKVIVGVCAHAHTDVVKETIALFFSKNLNASASFSMVAKIRVYRAGWMWRFILVPLLPVMRIRITSFTMKWRTACMKVDDSTSLWCTPKEICVF